MKKNEVLRISSFAYHVGDKPYQQPVTPDSEYVVDDSNFVPISEAVRQLVNGYGAGNRAEQLYDFPDGKDNGQPVPFSRSSQFKDIAELSTEVATQQEQINSALQEAQNLEKLKNETKEQLAPTPTTGE